MYSSCQKKKHNFFGIHIEKWGIFFKKQKAHVDTAWWRLGMLWTSWGKTRISGQRLWHKAHALRVHSGPHSRPGTWDRCRCGFPALLSVAAAPLQMGEALRSRPSSAKGLSLTCWQGWSFSSHLAQGNLFLKPSCRGGGLRNSCVCMWVTLSRVWLFVSRIVAHQATLSMRFSRQEYWSGLPFSSPGDLPDPGIEPRSPALQAGSLLSDLPGKPGNPYFPAIPISLT